MFDQKNQLTQIPGSNTYAYDASGRRVSKTVGGVTTYYFYSQAGQLLYQWAPGSAQSTSFVYLGSKLVGDNETVVLAAPTTVGFDANPNNGSYTVSWGAVPVATSYLLQESANGGGWTTVYSGSALSSALSGRAGGSYVYRVEGCIGTACGAWTTSATLGVRPALPTVTVPSGTINGTYTVSWTAPASTTSYDVQESFNGGAWNTIASSTAATSISRPGTTGGNYTYQVSAKNAYGIRGWASSSAVLVSTILGNIDGLTAPDASGNVSLLGWACSTGIAQSISVDLYLGGPAGSGVFISRTSANQSSEPAVAAACQVGAGSYRFNIPVTMTTRSQYAGKAIYVHGISPVSGPNLLIGNSGNILVPAVPAAPSPPATLTVPASSNNGSATLSWSASSTATRYVVEQSSNGGTSWTGIYNSSGTSTALSGLADGSYVFHVQACSTFGCSGWATGSATLVVTHPPTTAPTISAPANSTNGSYTVSWSGVTGQVSYTLQEQVNGGGWATVQTNGMTSWGTSGRGNGAYGYHVQACNVGGCGPWSGTGTTTVLLPPPTPASISVPATSNGPIAISWAASATATIYGLDQSVNGGTWAQVYANSATSTTVTATSSGSYSYRAYACNTSGCNGYATSGAVAVTIPPASAPSVSVPASSTNGSYTVTWGGVSGATSYTLQEQVNGGGWTTVQANGNTSWSTSGRSSGSYGYHVQACNAGGCGPWSGSASISVLLPPAAPAYVTAPDSLPYPSGVWAVNWASVSGAASYNAQRTNTGTNTVVSVYSGTGTSVDQSNLVPGTYVFSVQACNASGCSGWQTSGTVTVSCTASTTFKSKLKAKGVQPYLLRCP